MGYNPVVKVAQGNQPYTESYQVLLSVPSNVPPGAPFPVSLVLSALSQPTGVSAATALSYVTLSSNTVTVSAPGQVIPVTISIAVPLGSPAGGYSWKLLTTGWPTTLPGGVIDSGHTINGLFSPPTSIDNSPPAIVLSSPVNGTVYTYSPLSGIPVTVPVNFSATVGAGGAPITGLNATVNGSPITVSSTGISTLAAAATGSLQLTAPGTYLLSATATNNNGSSEATSEISVVVNAPPPTITVAAPANNATYDLVAGSAGVSVPVNFSATSLYGNITALAATLNGSPITLNKTGEGSALIATGGATLNITTPGNYSLVFTASNAYGQATPVTVPFTVKGVIPAPSVTILTPVAGTVYNRVAGDPATVVNYSFQGGTTFGTITAVTVKLNGTVITPALSGLNTAAVSGSGSVNFTSAGAHTITVTLSNGSGSATASTHFTVAQTQPPLCRDLTWLTPISLNKTIEGGSTMPIKFTLTCRGDFVRDTNVVISIYEVFSNGSTSAATLYPYGTGSPNPPDYAITGNKYHLNFATAKGKHRYQIDVYTIVNGTAQLLGSKILNTAKTGKGDDDDDDDDDCHGGRDDDDDDHHHGDRDDDCDRDRDEDRDRRDGRSRDRDCD